jgi:pyruvate dehydrogenase E2 component (dihydrolipoamide acetyltransferase)
MAGQITALTMPKWGLAMTEGKVVAWNLEEGASVEAGQGIVEIETEKITNICEAPIAGVLRRRVASEGETLAVGALLGVIADASVPDEEITRFVKEFRAETPDMAAAEAQAPRSTSVEVNGRPIRYLQMGEAGGLPILLIHGFGGDLNNWLFNQPVLSQKHTVYALDLPGHGGSSKEVGNGDIAAMTAAVIGFLNAVGVARAHLVGHSLGGGIALNAALEHPSRVATLTLISPVGLGADVDASYIQDFIQAERRKEMKNVLGRLFAKPEIVGTEMINNVLKYKRLEGVKTALSTVAQAIHRGNKQALVLRERLSELNAPTQVIWGEKDSILPAAQASGLPSAISVHLLSGAGHMAHMEQPQEVNKLIERLVSSV